MSIIGEPSNWIDLIDSLVPDIIRVVIASWEGMSAPAPDAKEDKISEDLCRTLRQNRDARKLPFRVDYQQVELDPAEGEDLGRLDISFAPASVPREDIYFCLECKRLNVIRGRLVRSYASEYVTHGVARFVSGQYASQVRHGGMLAYVLDGNTTQAIRNVESNLAARHDALGMEPPGIFVASTVLACDHRVKETRHRRNHEAGSFCLHHMFMARKNEPQDTISARTRTPERLAAPRKRSVRAKQ
jgi:hypothetical protein